jgi:hypothetical protein
MPILAHMREAKFMRSLAVRAASQAPLFGARLMSADQCKGTTNNIWIATPMVLAAVDLQWNLVCLLKEFLSYAQHSKLVICRFRLGKAGLYDEDSDRNTASTAEFFDVNQPLPGTNFEASGPTALGSQSLSLEQMREEVSPTVLVVQPKYASLCLTANLVHIADP